MNILVVDDLRTFQFEGLEAHHARNSDDAIGYLFANDVDIVFLDHDLGGYDTTIPVARYLKQISFPGEVYIHTSNPVGRNNLGLELPQAKGSEFWNGPEYRVIVESHYSG